MEAELIIIALAIPLGLIVAAIAIIVVRGLQNAGFYSWLQKTFSLPGVFVGLFITLVLLCVLVWSALAILGILGPILFFIVLFVLVEVYRKYRASRQYALLWLLTVTAEREVPLTAALEAFAGERWGPFGRRARRLAELLDSGVSLADGLDQVRGLLPPHAAAMVRVGCRSGALAPALRRAAAENELHGNGPIWTALTGKIAYLLLLTSFGISIVAFLVTWIVPEYQKIFKDFDLPLPHSTQLLVGLSQFSVSYWYLFYPLFVLGMALLFLPAACYFGWDLPGMNWFTRRLDAADLLDGLALTARQQKQMLDGLDALAQSHPRTNIRLRLLQAVKDVQAGRDWAESLSSRGLLRRPDLAILQAAGRVGNLPWALREMAESNRRRFAYRLQAIVQAVFPPVVILLGVIVGFIAVALFLPLVLLIQALS